LADQAAFARQVLSTEADAVARITIDAAFHRAVDLVLAATSPPQHGSVVVTGVGKSGLIGAKLSATFASTGTPSHFLHPTEAMHGDLGRIRRGDVVLALSYGGTTEEVVALATILRQDALPVVAIVGKPGCELATLASVALSVGDVNEACPLNLAPPPAPPPCWPWATPWPSASAVGARSAWRTSGASTPAGPWGASS